jgi:pimeloyl-ACP methyl ester carboxylesterase
LATSSAPDDLKPHIKLLTADQGIAYVDVGPRDTGDAVVLVHGSLCDWRYWMPQLREMDEAFRLVAPSLAHYHPRLPSAATTPFAWSRHVEQLAAFLPRIDAQRVHLVGHSRGALVAYQLALRQPGLLSSLTLIDPGGRGAGFDADDGNVRQRAADLIDAGQVEEGLRLFVDAVTQPGLWDRSPLSFRTMIRDNAHTLVLQVADPLPAYEETEARAIEVPALVVDGERSPVAFRDNARRLGDWMARATRLTIPGASHGMTLTHFQRFNRELTAFVRSV